MEERDPLRELMRTLPRASAEQDFTREVLLRLDRRPARRPRLLAAAATLLVGLLALGTFHEVRERQANARELAEEQAAIRKELDELKRMAAEYEPVVYIDGKEVDYVLDLREQADGTPARSVQQVSQVKGGI